jgi:hypothetical protein
MKRRPQDHCGLLLFRAAGLRIVFSFFLLPIVKKINHGAGKNALSSCEKSVKALCQQAFHGTSSLFDVIENDKTWFPHRFY